MGKGLGTDFLEQMAEESMSSDKGNKGGKKGRNRTVTMEENDEALRLAMEQYAKLTIPWQKEKLITQTKKSLEKKKKKKEEEQEAVAQKLQDPNYVPEKEELEGHATTLSIMLAEQKAMTSALQQSKSIIIDFLKDDGREALVAFFKIKGGL